MSGRPFLFSLAFGDVPVAFNFKGIHCTKISWRTHLSDASSQNLATAHAGIGDLGFSPKRIVLKGGHQPGSFSFDFFLGEGLEQPSHGIVEMLDHAPRIIGDTRRQARGILFGCGSLQLGVGRGDRASGILPLCE